MWPILLQLGPVTITTFGLFLGLSFLTAVFVFWRVSRSYEIDEITVLDLAFATAFVSFIIARVYFVILNINYFDNITQVVLIHKYPGFSFWGGLMGGFLTLWFLTQRRRLRFWQIADFAAVAVVAASVVGDLGCFLGGCQFYGQLSGSVFSFPVAGVIGKRFPISLIESVLLLFLFFKLWKRVVRYHFEGKIISLFLITIGIIRLIMEFYRGDVRPFFLQLSYGHVLALLTSVLGIIIFYRQARRNIISDIKFCLTWFLSGKERREVVFKLRKGWYNHRVNWRLKIARFIKDVRLAPENTSLQLRKLKRRLHVKSTPTNFN